MDPITTAIVTALTTGAVSGLTETSKTSITESYTTLKNQLRKKFGTKSQILQAVKQLESEPTSVGHQTMVQEELVTLQADQDTELLGTSRFSRSLCKRSTISFMRSLTLTQIQRQYSISVRHSSNAIRF